MAVFINFNLAARVEPIEVKNEFSVSAIVFGSVYVTFSATIHVTPGVFLRPVTSFRVFQRFLEFPSFFKIRSW